MRTAIIRVSQCGFKVEFFDDGLPIAEHFFEEYDQLKTFILGWLQHGTL